MGFADDYNDVAQRRREFFDLHPDGSLRPLNPDRPFWLETIDGSTFLVYAAAAYRTPDDPAPGVGCAWEPFPGRTNFTRDSELQNAETSAWGRAIIAASKIDAKKIASREEVVNRRQDQTPQPASEVLLLEVRDLFATLPDDVQAAKDLDALIAHAAKSDGHANAVLAKLNEAASEHEAAGKAVKTPEQVAIEAERAAGKEPF